MVVALKQKQRFKVDPQGSQNGCESSEMAQIGRTQVKPLNNTYLRWQSSLRLDDLMPRQSLACMGGHKADLRHFMASSKWFFEAALSSVSELGSRLCLSTKTDPRN